MFLTLKNFKATFNETIFDSYFQWEACTYFQEICNWTSYNDGKSLTDIQSFWLDPFVFVLQKYPKNLNF